MVRFDSFPRSEPTWTQYLINQAITYTVHNINDAVAIETRGSTTTSVPPFANNVARFHKGIFCLHLCLQCHKKVEPSSHFRCTSKKMFAFGGTFGWWWREHCNWRKHANRKKKKKTHQQIKKISSSVWLTMQPNTEVHSEIKITDFSVFPFVFWRLHKIVLKTFCCL